MPLSATVTPLSLYMLDNTVFDGLQLPTMPQNPTSYPDLYVEGFALDREVLVNNILMETGELDCIYPDPDFFKFAVTQWSKKELHVWQALYNTLFYKYTPLWNKDGTIKETARDLTSRETAGTRSRTGSSEQDVTDTIRETDTHNLTDQRTANLRTQTSDITENTGTQKVADSTSKRTVTADTTQNTGTQEMERSKSGQEARDGDVHTAVSGSTTNTGTVTDAGTSSETETHSGNVTTSGTNGTETQVSGYNETTYQNKDKSVTTTAQTVTDATSITTNGTKGNTRTDNLTEGRTETTQVDDNSVIDTTETEDTTRTDNLTTAYDSDSTETGSGTTTRTDNLTTEYDSDRQETGTDTTTHTGTLGRQGDNTRSTEEIEEESEETSGTEEGSLDHSLTRTETGNIGVTMTTQLIAAQRELVQLNFYDLIVERFKERFCLLVY